MHGFCIFVTVGDGWLAEGRSMSHQPPLIGLPRSTQSVLGYCSWTIPSLPDGLGFQWTSGLFLLATVKALNRKGISMEKEI
jgi:hypothetical protein